MAKVHRGSSGALAGRAGVALCAVLLASSALAACGTSGTKTGSSDGAESQASTTVTVALNRPTDGLFALFNVADSKGWYNDAKLQVKLQGTSGTATALSLLAAGRADFGYVGATDIVKAIADEQLPIKSVALTVERPLQSTITLKSSGITTIQQLQGRSVGQNATGSTTAVFPIVLQTAGVTKDLIKEVSMDTAAMAPALLAGKIDAYNTFAITAASTQSQVNVIPWYNYGLDGYGNVLVANTNFLAKHPTAAKAFVQATMRGLQFTVDNPSEAGKIAAQAQQGPAAFFVGELEIAKSYVATADVLKNGLGRMTDATWEQTQQQSVKFLGQKNKVPVSDLYTNSYLEAEK